MDIEKQIDEIAENLLDRTGNDLNVSLGSRQILIISSAIFHSASVKESTSSSDTYGQAYIDVRGNPSPSSDVTRGFIRFVSADKIRTPTYSPSTKIINLWLDQKTISMALEQMKHVERYLWIGFFAGGHVYSDIHSTL